MASLSHHLRRRMALLVSAAAVLPLARVAAQEPVVATARASARPITGAGVDSGKLLLALKISGIPEVGRRTLRLDQIVLADAAGRTYTPSGYSVGAGGTKAKNLLTAYSTPQAERLADRQYLFLVAPGSMAFELRVAGLKPVRVVPSLAPSSP